MFLIPSTWNTVLVILLCTPLAHPQRTRTPFVRLNAAGSTSYSNVKPEEDPALFVSLLGIYLSRHSSVDTLRRYSTFTSSVLERDVVHDILTPLSYRHIPHPDQVLPWTFSHNQSSVILSFASLSHPTCRSPCPRPRTRTILMQRMWAIFPRTIKGPQQEGNES